MITENLLLQKGFLKRGIVDNDPFYKLIIIASNRGIGPDELSGAFLKEGVFTLYGYGEIRLKAELERVLQAIEILNKGRIPDICFKSISSMKPSDFSSIDPMGSVLQKSEHETIAQNIMVILKRTGDKFRELSWDQYATERKKDGNFSDGEKKYFEEVIGYCKSPDTAKLFSPAWADVN